MAKLTKKSTNMTSFYDTTIICTANQLIAAIGKPQYAVNDAEEKINFEWECETKSGKVFTIYDWKEYRELDLNEKIKWHIGGFSFMDTMEAKDELMAQIIKNKLENA
jgi:hypothetical protein